MLLYCQSVMTLMTTKLTQGSAMSTLILPLITTAVCLLITMFTTIWIIMGGITDMSSPKPTQSLQTQTKYKKEKKRWALKVLPS